MHYHDQNILARSFVRCIGGHTVSVYTTDSNRLSQARRHGGRLVRSSKRQAY